VSTINANARLVVPAAFKHPSRFDAPGPGEAIVYSVGFLIPGPPGGNQGHFANLLRKIAEAEREQSLREVNVSDTAGLIAAISGRIPTARLQSGEAGPV
jgi:hypothetical protein